MYAAVSPCESRYRQNRANYLSSFGAKLDRKRGANAPISMDAFGILRSMDSLKALIPTLQFVTLAVANHNDTVNVTTWKFGIATISTSGLWASIHMSAQTAPGPAETFGTLLIAPGQHFRPACGISKNNVSITQYAHVELSSTMVKVDNVPDSSNMGAQITALLFTY